MLGEHQETLSWGVISEQEGGMLNINRVTNGRRKEPPCASPQPSLRNEGAAVRWCVCHPVSQARSWQRSWALISTPSWRQGRSHPRSPQRLTPLVTASQWEPSGPGDGCVLEKCHLPRLAKKKGGKLLLFSRHLLAFPGTDG